MNKPVRFTAKQRLLVCLASLIGALLVLVSTSRYGAGLYPDSVGYISAARGIASGLGMVSYDGTPLVVQPPFYPALLALVAVVSGIDPLMSASVVNAIIFGLIVFLSAVLVLRHLSGSRALVVIAILTVLFSPLLIGMSVIALSEPLFILFVLAFLIFSEQYLAKGDVTSLGMMLMAAALGSLTRFLGVTLILSGIAAILLGARGTLRAKVLHLSVFALGSSIPLGLWLVRNYIVSGSLFGPRLPSDHTLAQNLGFLFSVLLSWSLPIEIVSHRSLLLLTGALIVVLAGVVWVSCRNKLRLLLPGLSPASIFILFYLGVLILSATMAAYDPIDDRYMSPIYAPLVILAFEFVERLTQLLGQRFSPRAVSGAVVIGATAWLVLFPLRITFSYVTDWINQGAGGYSSIPWREDTLVNFVAQHPLEADRAVYSNAPDILYVLANVPSKMVPTKMMDNCRVRLSDVSALQKSWPIEESAYLIWSNRVTWRCFLFTPDELQAIVDLQPVVQLGDGVIYAMRASR